MHEVFSSPEAAQASGDENVHEVASEFARAVSMRRNNYREHP